MWGPPGNGKTISLKAIMKGCSDAGFLPLYVKSFTSEAIFRTSVSSVSPTDSFLQAGVEMKPP